MLEMRRSCIYLVLVFECKHIDVMSSFPQYRLAVRWCRWIALTNSVFGCFHDLLLAEQAVEQIVALPLI